MKRSKVNGLSKFNHILDEEARNIRKETGSVSCSIYWFNSNRTRLNLRGSNVAKGLAKKAVNEDHYLPGQGLTWSIATRQTYINTKNASLLKSTNSKYRNYPGPFLGMPIIVDGFSRGVIKLVREAGQHKYNENTEALVKEKLDKLGEKLIKNDNDYSNTQIASYNSALDLSSPPEHNLNLFHETLSGIEELDELVYEVLDVLSCKSRIAALFRFDKRGRLERTHQSWHYNPSKPFDQKKANEKVKENYGLEENSLVGLACQGIEEEINGRDKDYKSKGATINVLNVRKEKHISENANIHSKLEEYEKLINALYKTNEKITHALVVPVRSNSRVSGVVCILNKLDYFSRLDEKNGFSDQDITWVESLVNALSINLLRLKKESKHNITKRLNESFRRSNEDLKHDTSVDLNDIAKEIAGPLTSYAACVIRMYDLPLRRFKVKGLYNHFDPKEKADKLKQIYSLVEETQNDKGTSIKEGEELLALENVLIEKKPKEIKDIQDNLALFASDKWIKTHDFQGAYFQPILDKSERYALGAIAIYVGYDFDFSQTHKDNLQELAQQLSIVMEVDNDALRKKTLSGFSLRLEERETRFRKGFNQRGSKANYHKLLIREILKISILEIEKYTMYDQCVVARGIPGKTRPNGNVSLQVVKSLDSKQDYRRIDLPNAFTESMQKNDHYIYRAAEDPDFTYVHNDDIRFVKEMLCLPFDLLIDRYLFHDKKETPDLLKTEINHYYLLLVVLNNPYRIGDHGRNRRVRPRLDSIESDNPLVLRQYEFFTGEITKFIKYVKRDHDFYFISNILDRLRAADHIDHGDDVTEATNEIDVIENLLEEIRHRMKWTVQVNLALIDKNAEMISNVMGKGKESIVPFSLREERPSQQVYIQKESRTYIEGDKELEQCLEQCSGIKGVTQLHISPMTYRGDVIGLLYVFGVKPNFNSEERSIYSSDYRFFLDTAADQFAVGIKEGRKRYSDNLLVSKLIHDYRNMLNIMVLNPLTDIEYSQDLEYIQHRIADLKDWLQQYVDQTSNQIITISEGKQSEINQKDILFVFEKLKTNHGKKARIGFHFDLDVSLSDVRIKLNAETLIRILDDLTNNAIQAYIKRDKVKALEGSKNLSRVIYISCKGVKKIKHDFVEFTFTNKDTLLPKHIENSAGLAPIKSAKSGHGLFQLNRLLHDLKALPYQVPIGSKVTKSRDRYFNIKQIDEPFKGVRITFCIPVEPKSKDK